MKSVEDSTIFMELSAAPESSPTYETALDAGVVALKLKFLPQKSDFPSHEPEFEVPRSVYILI